MTTLALAAPPPVQPVAQAMVRIDERLTALTRSLQGGDAQLVHEATESLVAALDAAAPLLRVPGAMTSTQRSQLAHAVGRLAGQREALARAGGAVARAIDVLLPAPGGLGTAGEGSAATYSPAGFADRRVSTGSTWA